MQFMRGGGTKAANYVYNVLPEDRVTALRRAFDATVRDPAFLADFKKRKLPVGPTKGEDLQAFIEKVIATPKSTVKELKAALKSK